MSIEHRVKKNKFIEALPVDWRHFLTTTRHYCYIYIPQFSAQGLVVGVC